MHFSAPMADSEKLTALKKAYADIILNTAKEAAARIMLSEKKAQRYQNELFAAKDEALRLLLRLKQMLDAKVSEAEMTSLNQQKRIEELEAQLGEAEDIVKDLRQELREIQDELEKVTNNQMQPLSNSGGDITAHVTSLEENRLCSSGYVVSSPPGAQCEPLISLEMNNPTFNGTSCGNKCFCENGPHKDNCFVYNPDFASIMMRRKEPELYRNGCTQRIRAFERNLLDGDLSLSGQANDVKNQIFIKEDEEDKYVCKIPTAMADNMCRAEKSLDEIEVMQANGDCNQVHDVSSFRRKRKRGTRYKKHRTSSFKSSPDQAVDKNVHSTENSTIENMAQKDPESPVTPKSHSFTNDMNVQSGSEEVTKSNTEFSRVFTVQNTVNNDDKLRTGELEVRGQKAGSTESTEFPACKTNLEIASALNTDSKESDEGEVLPTEQMNYKFLKYTFRRKRKKEFPSSPDGYSSLDDSNLKRKIVEKQSDSLKSQKSCIITESSRDSRRLAQVARQLISLSRNGAC